jgi:hypothetical protein
LPIGAVLRSRCQHLEALPWGEPRLFCAPSNPLVPAPVTCGRLSCSSTDAHSSSLFVTVTIPTCIATLVCFGAKCWWSCRLVPCWYELPPVLRAIVITVFPLHMWVCLKPYLWRIRYPLPHNSLVSSFKATKQTVFPANSSQNLNWHVFVGDVLLQWGVFGKEEMNFFTPR